MEGLIVVATVVADWGIALGLWWGFKRITGRQVPERVDVVMPWLVFQVFLFAGLVVTGALATAGPGAVLLTGIPVSMIAAFFAVPLVFIRREEGRPLDWRVCLDHSLATASVWLAVLAVTLVV